MKRVVFDNSIHLGQFAINNETMRIACKNSQALISNNGDNNVIGIESFNENTYSDDRIWSIPREPQDAFYPFMDVYHSIKNIQRVPLTTEQAEIATSIAREFTIHISNALTCVIALECGADEIHSLYKDFEKSELKSFLQERNISVCVPEAETEAAFTPADLEDRYQISLDSFKKHSIDTTSDFHQ